MLDVGTLPYRDDMTVFSEVVEPVVFSQTFCRFRLSNTKGILDSNSKLQLTCTNSGLHRAPAGGGADVNQTMSSFLPVGTGIHSLIERAELLIGGKIICSIDDNPFFQTIKKGFHPTDDRWGLDQCYEGDYLASQIGQGQNNGNACNKAQLMTRRKLPRSLLITNQDTTTPSFSISLGDLFPFMRRKQLPLYLIDEPVTLQLTFTNKDQQGAMACYNQEVTNAATNAASDVTIDQVGCKLFLDYLIYDNEKMEELRGEMATKGLSFIYEDTLLVKKAMEAQPLATSAHEQNLELGGQGRIVRGILVGATNETTVGTAAVPGAPRKLLGNYMMNAEEGGFEINWRFNDKRLFNRDCDKDSVKHYLLSQVEANGGYWVPKPYMSYELHDGTATAGVDVLTNTCAVVGAAAGQNSGCDFEGNTNVAGANTQLHEQLRGTMSPYGVWVAPHHYNAAGSGLLIGSKPIICEFKRTGAGATPANAVEMLRFWIIFERHFVLRDGKIYISY